MNKKEYDPGRYQSDQKQNPEISQKKNNVQKHRILKFRIGPKKNS